MAKRWTNEEIQYLTQNYPVKPIQKLCKHLGFNRQRIHDKANLLGIKKIKYFTTVTEKSKATQFKKGMISWNKGLKCGSDFGGKETRFKPGQTPHNKLPKELKELADLKNRLLKNVKERIKRKKI